MPREKEKGVRKERRGNRNTKTHKKDRICVVCSTKGAHGPIGLVKTRMDSEVYESDNEERTKNVNHRGNENDEEWPCKRIPMKKEPVEPCRSRN